MNIQNIIETKVKEGFLALYNIEIPSVEFQATRKEFEGDITVVVFPLLRYKKGNPVQIGEDLGKYVVENVNGVISFVGSSGKPEALKPDEVKRFLGDHDGADGPIVITEAAPFKVGDLVNVKDGPFVDFSGTVQEVSHEKQKLKVSVSIFGRSTPVELDYLQVALDN